MRFERFTADDNTMPFWLTNCVIRGFEGEGEGEGEGGSESEGGEGEGEGESGSEGEGGGSSTSDDAAALKTALERERANAKTALKEKKALQKRLDALDAKDRSAVDQATADATKATEKVTRLATRLRETSIEQAIITTLNGKDMPKFADVDDVLKLIDRSAFSVEQDEDDPADITIDKATVKAAILQLSKNKKHLLVGATKDENDDDPSGGQFGGGGKNKNKMTEEAIRALYPSLN